MARRSAWRPTKPLTTMGFAGRGGGRWGRVPSPEMWFATSQNVAGIYPFGTGTAAPVTGAPLGRDRHSGSAVAMDHHSLYMEGVISSPSCMMFGINGVGKSSTAQTIVLGQMARGMVPAVWNPLKKGEHTPLVERAGGRVFELGPTSSHRLNLLSLGPLGRAAQLIGGETGEELRELAISKVVEQTKVVLQVSRRGNLTDIEEHIIEILVEDVVAHNRRPRTRDLERAFSSPSESIMARTGFDSVDRFHDRHRSLGESIRALMGGDLGRMLSGDDSMDMDPGNRGGFCFDTSSIPSSSTRLLSSAMLLSWSMGMDAIDAHWELAKYEAEQAAAAAAEREHYTPRVVWTGYTTLMDEFWYPIRSTPGIVDRADNLSRSNRSVGTAEMKVTHSPKDMLSLPNPEDREKARGLAERSGLLALMSLTRSDLEELSDVKPLTRREIEEVVRFNGSSSWAKAPNAVVTKPGQAAVAPPGAGKVLFKVEGRPGISVQMVQTDVQKSLHITDSRFRAQHESTAKRRIA